MDDVVITETAHYVSDSVGFTDVAEELVPETFAVGCASLGN